MLLVCSACGARELLENGAEVLLASAPRDQLRCPACGRAAAHLRPGEPARAAGEQPDVVGTAPSAPPLADLDERDPAELARGWWGRELMLRVEGHVTHLAGLDPLRRLVIEGAASPSDLVSRDGVCWEPLEHIPELQPYLAVRRHLGRSAGFGGQGGLADASSAAAGWAGAEETTESLPRPGRSGDARRSHAAPDSSQGA